MKRQDSLRSSSSPRDNNSVEKLHATTIGCMSGVIKLVCKSHSPWKLLTFGSGKKQIKNATVPSTSTSPTKVQQGAAMSKGREPRNTRHCRSLSCDLLRSPTLSAEIRHLNSLSCSESMRTSRSLIPKLIGLDESAPSISTPRATMAVHKPESTAEKRQRLLASLQKCDEDLKALKKIIEDVQSAKLQRTQQPPKPVVSESTASSVSEQMIGTVSEKTLLELTGDHQQLQKPSPVSVLDELSRSPLGLAGYSSRRHSSGQVLPKQKQPLLKKQGEEQYFLERIAKESIHRKGESELSRTWNSKAMIDSVEEVCRDIAWGQKREIERIGLAVQDCICRDLIEEIVRELGRCRFNSCKRRLSF